jgi:hypothetical protein
VSPDSATNPLSPAVQVLADAAELEGAALRLASGVDPERVAVLAATVAGGTRLLVANLDDEARTLDLGSGVEVGATTFLDPAGDSSVSGRHLRLAPLAYARLELRERARS